MLSVNANTLLIEWKKKKIFFFSRKKIIYIYEEIIFVSTRDRWNVRRLQCMKTWKNLKRVRGTKVKTNFTHSLDDDDENDDDNDDDGARGNSFKR